MNVLFNAPSMTATAAQHGLAQIVRSPLAMGALGMGALGALGALSWLLFS